ncbi:MAG: DUF4149 domain-containing protein [Methylophilus sp.]
MLRKLSLVVITLWVGGLWITGFSAYTLFNLLQSKQMAGGIAGHLFTTMSYIGMFGGAFLLIQRFIEYGTTSFKQSYFWAVLAMFLLVLAGHFGIQPLLAQMKADALPNDVMKSVFASRFSTWHGVASFAYLVECLLGFVLIFKAR